MKKRMKPLLPILLIVVLVLTVCGSVGMTYSKYVYSKDVANISLKVIPQTNTDEKSPTQYNLDVTNTHNLMVTEVNGETTFETNLETFIALQFIANEGYALPETIEIVIAEERYVVSTVQAEENAEEFEWISEDNLLLVSSDIIPAEGCTIFVYAEGVAISEENEPEETAPEPPKAQYNLDVTNTHNLMVTEVEGGATYGTDIEQFLALQFIVNEGYALPETIEIVITEERYVVSTVQTEENSEKFEWISEDNLLLVSTDIIPAGDCTIYVYAEAVVMSGESEQEETVPEETEETQPAETIPEETEETQPAETIPEETEETQPAETVPEETEETQPVETPSEDSEEI